VLEIRPARLQPLHEVEKDIQCRLIAQRREQIEQQIVQELRRSADIMWDVSPAAKNQPQSAQTPAAESVTEAPERRLSPAVAISPCPCRHRR
jgi:hypothetical protein